MTSSHTAASNGRAAFRARPSHALLALLIGVGPVALAAFVTAAPTAVHAQLVISVNLAPPPLPVYAQPVIPAPGYMWQPGYWAWDGDFGDYYWVPGTWVQAPEPGLLWTPGYWGWSGGAYLFHGGYWGSEVGYYGGVSYGFGYSGHGYGGGYWNNNQFFYNRSVNNISSVHITNVYNKTVVEGPASHASFNGPGGVSAQPTAKEMAAQSQRHVPPTAAQTQNEHAAAAEPTLRASANHGAPPVAATSHPGQFKGADVVKARAGSNPNQPRTPAGARPEAAGARPEATTAHAAPAEASAAKPAHASPAPAARHAPAPTEAASPASASGDRRPAPPREAAPAPAPAEHAERRAETAQPAPTAHARPAPARPAPASHAKPPEAHPPAPHKDEPKL